MGLLCRLELEEVPRHCSQPGALTRADLRWAEPWESTAMGGGDTSELPSRWACKVLAHMMCRAAAKIWRCCSKSSAEPFAGPMAYSHLPFVGSPPHSTGILEMPWVNFTVHLRGSATKFLQDSASWVLKRGPHGVSSWVFFRFKYRDGPGSRATS